jgi:hypothetical protein
MLKFLKFLFQLIISPTPGWEDISHEGRDAKLFATEGLYPLLGITALSTFITYFFNDSGLIALLQKAIITFIQYFASYFIAIFLFSVHISKYIDGEPNEKRITTFITFNIAILAIIRIIENCLPIELSIVQFLPVFVAIVMWKGTKYMAVNKNKIGQFMLLSIISIIVTPYLLQALFNFILPS